MIRIVSNRLHEAWLRRDRTQRGTREQLDQRDREELEAWRRIRERAADHEVQVALAESLQGLDEGIGGDA